VALPSGTVGELAHLGDGRVGQDLLAGGRIHRELPWRLPAGLVEGREDAPRVERLELRDHVPIVAFALAEEPARGDRLDRAAEAQLGHAIARGKAAVHGEADEVRMAGEDARGQAALAEDELGLHDLQLLGVQPEHRCRAIDLELDAHLAFERRLARIDREAQPVGARRRGVAQAESGRLGILGEGGKAKREEAGDHAGDTFHGREDTRSRPGKMGP
jgi:hypothetical protein